MKILNCIILCKLLSDDNSANGNQLVVECFKTFQRN